MNLLVRRSHKAFVITFRPGGLYRLLGIPLHELYDDGFEGRELMGPEIESLTNQILEADTFLNMSQIAEAFLLKKAGVHKTIASIRCSPSTIDRCKRDVGHRRCCRFILLKHATV